MIYLDNNATTQPSSEIRAAMLPYLERDYGNPSSAHDLGTGPRDAVTYAREQVAELVGASSPNEIFFTSCGTESDNWAILGTILNRDTKGHIVTTVVEHDAVRNLCLHLERKGYDVTWVPVNEDGTLDLEQLAAAVRPDTALVSVMLANNETGVLFPIQAAAEIVKEKSNAIFHTDAVNAAGKVKLNTSDTLVDLLSISAHKFHGPKGVGALYIRRGVELAPLFIGGGQESSRRPGTEAVHQIVGLGAAARYAADLSTMDRVRRMRDRLENTILERVPASRINGNLSARLPNTTNISFRDVNGEMLLARLNEKGIYASTGAACNAADRSASHVLQAMDLPYSWAMGSIRFSLGRLNSNDDVDEVIEELPEIVDRLRNLSS